MRYNYNSGYGQALMNNIASQIPTFGRIFVVMNPNDTDKQNFQMMQDIMKSAPEGVLRFHTSVATAYAAAQSGNDDVIALAGNSPHVVTEMLTTSKSRVHFVGMDGGGRMIQQGSRIVMGVTGVASDLAPILDTGTRNSFINIKVENASTTNESLYGFISNGEGTYFENFMSAKTAGLNDANHAHFWMAGDACSGKNMTFGHSTIQSTAAGFGILIDAKSGGASHVKENIFENVRVNMSVDNGVVATSCFIKVADNAAMNFNNLIDKFTGMNFTPPGEAGMTDACLGTGGTSGVLDLIDPAFFGCDGVGAVTGIFIAARGLAPDANGGLATALTD